MTFAEAAEFYNLSPTTIQNWKRRVHSKTTRQTKPYKIPDDVLLNDVKEHPDDYQYERARRLNCSKTGIHHALKRLGISQKKDLRTSKSLSDQKSGVSGKAWSLYAARLSHRLYTRAVLSTRPSALMVTRLLVSLVLIATTGKVKSEPTLLGLCMKRCCLRLITLRQIWTAAYSTIGANKHWSQVLKQNAWLSWIMLDFIRISVFKSYWTGMVIVFYGCHRTAQT